MSASASVARRAVVANPLAGNARALTGLALSHGSFNRYARHLPRKTSALAILVPRTSEGFDNEVVKEINDFERIKRAEFKLQLGGLADAHIDYYGKVTSIWEQYVRDMEKQGVTQPTDGPEPPGRQLL
ncbi:hypothetical protein BN1723_003896 [Verticillium longisporum]|uniref:Uncharacterized protein n=1 Tax=Verticillium longisporum TaxID=100787 RepID=A0A0G4MG40_VERLO|nr:hypothetical protein BN1723_003896 [Verticillium longisporum]